ncbi:MAG: hypothetical protein H0V17_30325 [Deltaproteobacteria bacterium]|nr:hypothetical protein [Deltaproteobacteria bacterium]
MVEALKIRTYVIWIPMLDAEEISEVPSASQNVGVSPQYFDGSMKIGNGLGRNAGLDETVWDVFFFYPPGVKSNENGLPFPEHGIAQQGGVVVATPGTLPPLPDQSRMPRELRGKVIVVGDQKNIEELLRKAADAFLAQQPSGTKKTLP